MTVDDSPTVRMCLNATLTEAGYQVIQAVDGADALEKLQVGTIDMLVTDLNMPKMDGVALIKAVRDIPGYRLLPILMLTSETQSEQKEAGMKAGASVYVPKPFKPQSLLAVVKMVCPAD
jgi:two-component system chemotaxis response regulator CheY